MKYVQLSMWVEKVYLSSVDIGYIILMYPPFPLGQLLLHPACTALAVDSEDVIMRAVAPGQIIMLNTTRSSHYSQVNSVIMTLLEMLMLSIINFWYFELYIGCGSHRLYK